MSNRKLPVVVVLGCTGTGKSKLALDIARRFNGEVINADSMQVYKGLDIITNKVSTAEMEGITHHVMDFVDPLEDYTVVHFQREALPIIDELREKGKLPVIVGGTNYYIESLLWKVLVAHQSSSPDDGQRSNVMTPRTCITSLRQTTSSVDGEGHRGSRFDLTLRSDLEVFSNSCLYKRLQDVDPEMAQRVHPNNRRKILRSLEVFDKYGTTLTKILKEQKSAKGGSSLGGPLRFPNSCILWLQCEQNVLDKRLDDRVDDMIKRGLIQELIDFHLHFNQQRVLDQRVADYTRGIFQCIGFKEFHSYLLLTNEERQTVEAEKLFREGVDTLKLVTRRYARKQIKWITNRFLRCPDRQVPPVYALDATDPTDWETAILLPATEILTALTQNKTPAILPLAVQHMNNIDKHKQTYCEVCQKILLGDLQWLAHIKSRKHNKLVQKQRKHLADTKVTGEYNSSQST